MQDNFDPIPSLSQRHQHRKPGRSVSSEQLLLDERGTVACIRQKVTLIEQRDSAATRAVGGAS